MLSFSRGNSVYSFIFILQQFIRNAVSLTKQHNIPYVAVHKTTMCTWKHVHTVKLWLWCNIHFASVYVCCACGFILFLTKFFVCLLIRVQRREKNCIHIYIYTHTHTTTCTTIRNGFIHELIVSVSVRFDFDRTVGNQMKQSVSVYCVCRF